jgi:hypothetical protein
LCVLGGGGVDCERGGSDGIIESYEGYCRGKRQRDRDVSRSIHFGDIEEKEFLKGKNRSSHFLNLGINCIVIEKIEIGMKKGGDVEESVGRETKKMMKII